MPGLLLLTVLHGFEPARRHGRLAAGRAAHGRGRDWVISDSRAGRGLLATFDHAIFRREDGRAKSRARVSNAAQVVSAALSVLALYHGHEKIFLAGLCASRFGLWAFDLLEREILQTAARSDDQCMALFAEQSRRTSAASLLIFGASACPFDAPKNSPPLKAADAVAVEQVIPTAGRWRRADVPRSGTTPLFVTFARSTIKRLAGRSLRHKRMLRPSRRKRSRLFMGLIAEVKRQVAIGHVCPPTRLFFVRREVEVRIRSELARVIRMRLACQVLGLGESRDRHGSGPALVSAAVSRPNSRASLERLQKLVERPRSLVANSEGPNNLLATGPPMSKSA